MEQYIVGENILLLNACKGNIDLSSGIYKDHDLIFIIKHIKQKIVSTRLQRTIRTKQHFRNQPGNIFENFIVTLLICTSSRPFNKPSSGLNLKINYMVVPNSLIVIFFQFNNIKMKQNGRRNFNTNFTVRLEFDQ